MHAERTLPALLRILLISADEPTLARAIRFVSSHPERFTTHEVQVPCLEQVVAWCRKQRAAVHPLVMEWLRSLQQTLTTATAREPQPPIDWARPAEIACTCQCCRQLNEILADPTAETGRVRAREDLRSHVIQKIYANQCDVTHKLERKGSPHALVLTKTTGSFQRRMQRYVTERALLKTIHGLLLS